MSRIRSESDLILAKKASMAVHAFWVMAGRVRAWWRVWRLVVAASRSVSRGQSQVQEASAGSVRSVWVTSTISIHAVMVCSAPALVKYFWQAVLACLILSFNLATVILLEVMAILQVADL